MATFSRAPAPAYLQWLRDHGCDPDLTTAVVHEPGMFVAEQLVADVDGKFILDDLGHVQKVSRTFHTFDPVPPMVDR